MAEPATSVRRVIPLIPVARPHPEATRRSERQAARALAQAAFFMLFIMAPVFDLLRYDLVAGHAWLLGRPWHAGLEAFSAGQSSALEAGLDILLRVFVPILLAGGALIAVAWRWGRVYCGWLCPHFSVVETINGLMRRASGKHSVWDRRPVPARNPDGSMTRHDKRWWFAVVPAAIGFAFLWAVVLLTYLLPPFEVYGNLAHGTLTRNQTIFIAAGTVVLSIEFLFARHLFCRYACAVGLFQSLAWMSNRDAMVVGFRRDRAADCASCYSACDHVCPMRLKPRNVKHVMFTCTQCAQCVAACEAVQRRNPEGSLLAWVADDAARRNETTMSLTGSTKRSK